MKKIITVANQKGGVSMRLYPDTEGLKPQKRSVLKNFPAESQEKILPVKFLMRLWL